MAVTLRVWIDSTYPTDTTTELVFLAKQRHVLSQASVKTKHINGVVTCLKSKSDENILRFLISVL